MVFFKNLYEIVRVGKSIETINRLVDAYGWGWDGVLGVMKLF